MDNKRKDINEKLRLMLVFVLSMLVLGTVEYIDKLRMDDMQMQLNSLNSIQVNVQGLATSVANANTLNIMRDVDVWSVFANSAFVTSFQQMIPQFNCLGLDTLANVKFGKNFLYISWNANNATSALFDFDHNQTICSHDSFNTVFNCAEICPVKL